MNMDKDKMECFGKKIMYLGFRKNFYPKKYGQIHEHTTIL